MKIWWPSILFTVVHIEAGTQTGVGGQALAYPIAQPKYQSVLVRPYAVYAISPASGIGTCEPHYGGIRARLNYPAFAYMSNLFANILNEQIINAEIPPLLQCVPGLPVSGCVKIYNIFVSRYRCPQRVLVYPDKPNKIVLSVQNFDIGITANLGGELNILLTIPLCGIIQLNVHREYDKSLDTQRTIPQYSTIFCDKLEDPSVAQFKPFKVPYGRLSLQVSLVVEVVIHEKCDRFFIKVAGCTMKVGYVDLYMERAGLIGDLTNGLFRQIGSELVKQMIPPKVCEMIPKLINEKVNSRLADIPTAISVSQIIQMIGGLDGLLGGGNAQCAKTHRCRSAEPHKSQTAVTGQELIPLSGGALPKNVPLVAAYGATQRPLTTIETASGTSPTKQVVNSSTFKQHIPLAKGLPVLENSQEDASASTMSEMVWQDSSDELNSTKETSAIVDVSEETALLMLSELFGLSDGRKTKGSSTRTKNRPTFDDIKEMLHKGTSHETNRKLLEKLAEMTKAGETSEARQILASLRRVARDLATRRKRSPEYGPVPVVNKSPPKWRKGSEDGTQITNTPTNETITKKHAAPHAVVPLLTSNKQPKVHRTENMVRNGNYSRAHGCPTCVGGASSGSLSSAVGVAGNPCAGCPGTGNQADPLNLIKKLIRTMDLSKLCNIYLSLKLLRTLATCCDYTVDLKGEFSLCNQDQTPFCAPLTIFPGCANCMAEIIVTDYTINSLFYHMHRVGLLNFRIGPDTPEIGPLMRTTCEMGSEPGGISVCVGDFLPVVSRYPNKAIAVNIHTIRPPTVLFSRGCATIDFAADADICVTGTYACEGGIRVGTIALFMVADVCLRAAAGRLYGAGSVRSLQIIEKQPSLGLQPGTLNQLSVLGKELITKALNDALARGIAVRIPAGGGLPLTLHNTQFTIIEHGIHISSDFAISPSLFSSSATCPR